MPRYAASRTLLAPVEDVWAFVAEPYHLSDWWPGIDGVQPDRRGFATGARWQVTGPGMLRTAATLVVTDVVRGRRFAFEVPAKRLAAVLELGDHEGGRTLAVLAVQTPWLAIRRSLPREALQRLYDLVQTACYPEIP